MNSPVDFLIVLGGLIVGGLGGFGLWSLLARRRVMGSKRQEIRILERAEEQATTIIDTAKEKGREIRNEMEGERQETKRRSSRLDSRETNLDRRLETLEEREQDIKQQNRDLRAGHEEIAELKEKTVQQLESIAGLGADEARDLIMRRAEADMEHELSRRFFEIEQGKKQRAEQNARKIIALAIHRLAADVVGESTTNVVSIPNDDMKGRLIGREGRNIRAFEAATGVEVIIDDTPESVTLSCFDPVRREIGRLALTKLIKDGRIHPARIEDTVQKAHEEVEEIIGQEGERAVFETGVRGLAPELIKLLGRLKYRYSYGENILQHSIEVSLIAGMLASEIGASIEVAKAGGLLHDIGKALTHEVEGPHAEIGAEVARKYGIPPEVERAIMEHHDEEMGSIEAFLASAADAISAARPGARKESMEHYVKRLQNLEEAASGFPGVQKCFAIQAGREVRLMVEPETVDEITAAKLARDVVKKIEDTLVFPGQIKVTVIRETRNIEIAR